MNDRFVTLVGAEEVVRAATRMYEAATTMGNACGNLQAVLDAHKAHIDDWLLRFEQVLEADRQQRVADIGGRR